MIPLGTFFGGIVGAVTKYAHSRFGGRFYFTGPGGRQVVLGAKNGTLTFGIDL